MARQTTFKKLLTDPLLSAFGIAGFVISVLVFYGIKHRFTSEQWATWVQAVGSVSAIWISLALVQHQIIQQQKAEKARDAKNDFRIASFAESVIREAADAIRATERAQKAWPDAAPDTPSMKGRESRQHRSWPGPWPGNPCSPN